MNLKTILNVIQRIKFKICTIRKEYALKKSLLNSFAEIKIILQDFSNVKYRETFDIGYLLIDSASIRLISDHIDIIIVSLPNKSSVHIVYINHNHSKSHSFVLGSTKCVNTIMMEYPEAIYLILRLPEILRIVKTELFNK